MAVFVPMPRKQLFSAEAVPPAQVAGVIAEIKKTEVLKSTVTMDIAVTWDKLETRIAFYELRIVKDNTTISEAETVHQLQYVRENIRIFCQQ